MYSGTPSRYPHDTQYLSAKDSTLLHLHTIFDFIFFRRFCRSPAFSGTHTIHTGATCPLLVSYYYYFCTLMHKVHKTHTSTFQPLSAPEKGEAVVTFNRPQKAREKSQKRRSLSGFKTVPPIEDIGKAPPPSVCIYAVRRPKLRTLFPDF